MICHINYSQFVCGMLMGSNLVQFYTLMSHPSETWEHSIFRQPEGNHGTYESYKHPADILRQNQPALFEDGRIPQWPPWPDFFEDNQMDLKHKGGTQKTEQVVKKCSRILTATW